MDTLQHLTTGLAAAMSLQNLAFALIGCTLDPRHRRSQGHAGPVVAKLREVLQKAMADPEHVKKLEDQGLAIKVMVGDEYAKYFADTHAKAKKYTEWAKSRPHK